MWVVKLGGSLASRPARLRAWARALAGAQVVVVPGGGPYAEAVRTAQRRLGFDERTAHALALQAMAQFGLTLAALAPRLRPAGLQALERGRAAGARVWIPDAALLREASIPASWAVTSDSLAAWLARRLGARGVLLVKSFRAGRGGMPLARAARSGRVDPCFVRFLGDGGPRLRWARPEDHVRLRRLLREG